MKTKLFTYTIECWFRHGNDEKEFMTTTVFADRDWETHIELPA